MSAQYKTTHRVYSAWNYQKEIEDLNRASENGWQLVKGGCFGSRFVKNPDVRYRYQLDFRRIDDMARYIETFREQGWEYVSSTFNGWHYFRKLYDPSLPAEAYEIFTDRQSLGEMNGRWARLALIIGIVIGMIVLLSLVWMILEPKLPTLVLLLMCGVESTVLTRGALIMYSPDSSRNRRGDNALFVSFLCVILIGCTANLILTTVLRPHLSCETNAEEVTEPFADHRWISFEVKYPDWYYLDLEMKADTPFTLAVIDKDGRTVYSETGTEVRKDDVRLRLSRGEYWYTLTAEDGYVLKVSMK